MQEYTTVATDSQQPESILMGDYEISTTVDAPQKKVENELQEELVTTNNETYTYNNEFIAMLNDPSQMCIDIACIVRSYLLCMSERVRCNINLWIGTHVWLLLLLISNAYSIYRQKYLLNLLSINCSQFGDNYDGYDSNSADYDHCKLQHSLKNVDFIPVSIIIYGFMAYFSMNILSNFVALYGLRRCIGSFILQQMILLLLTSCVEIGWVILSETYLNLIVVIAYLFAARIFYRVYRWSRYFKNGHHLDLDFPMPE